MVPGTRYVRAFRGSKWTDKLSLGSLGEGDVFALFEEDGTRITGNGNSTFRAIKAPSLKGGVWGIDAEPYDASVPEIKDSVSIPVDGSVSKPDRNVPIPPRR